MAFSDPFHYSHIKESSIIPGSSSFLRGYVLPLIPFWVGFQITVTWFFSISCHRNCFQSQVTLDSQLYDFNEFIVVMSRRISILVPLVIRLTHYWAHVYILCISLWKMIGMFLIMKSSITRLVKMSITWRWVWS